MLGRPITTHLAAKLQYPQMLYACCLAYILAVHMSTTLANAVVSAVNFVRWKSSGLGI